MKGTNLSTTIISRLRENIAGPGGLHYLDLTNSNAGPKELAVLADCIKYNFQNIEGVAPLISMDLTGNHICGVDFLMSGSPDASGLIELINTFISIGVKCRMRKLMLSRNYIDLKGYNSLSNLLNNGPQSISELYLRDCGLTGDSIVKFMDGIKQSKYLQILDISHNNLGLTGCEALGEALSVNSKLRQLILSECDTGPIGMTSIVKGISLNVSLETLFLNDNNIQDDGAIAIANMIKLTTRVKHLDLQENNIGIRGITEISNAMKINRTVTFLGLQWNELTNDSILPLCEMVAINPILRSIHILGTQIDENGIKMILENSILSGDKKLDIDLAFVRI